MRYSAIILLLLLIGCSAYQVKQDPFDGSFLVTLKQSDNDYIRIEGNLNIYNITFSKEYKSGKTPDIKLLCVFKDSSDIPASDYIELMIDKTIYRLKADVRLGEHETSLGTSISYYGLSSSYANTLLEKWKTYNIVVETILPNEVVVALYNSKFLMFRVYTKNIIGVHKNTFKSSDNNNDSRWALHDIKEFINYIPGL